MVDEGPNQVRTDSMPAASLRALLERSIDYAGLFPPATLSLAAALQNNASYIRADESWMLNAFVLPIAQFGEATRFLTNLGGVTPIKVSALGPKTEDVDSFEQAVKSAIESIRLFNNTGATVVQCEIPLPATYGATFLERTATALRDIDAQVFFEATAARAEETIALLADCNSKSGKCAGFKLRTGGVTADAFPTSAMIARALISAAKYSVPIKFTAGLHHPVRMFREEVATKMHGFLNVLGAGVLAIEHGWDEAETAKMLEDENVDSFQFDAAHFRWREFEVNAAKIIEHRSLVTSFGSCSFDDPRVDLRALKLLP